MIGNNTAAPGRAPLLVTRLSPQTASPAQRSNAADGDKEEGKLPVNLEIHPPTVKWGPNSYYKCKGGARRVSRNKAHQKAHLCDEARNEPSQKEPCNGQHKKSGVQCYGCGKRGHYKRDCRSSRDDKKGCNETRGTPDKRGKSRSSEKASVTTIRAAELPKKHPRGAVRASKEEDKFKRPTASHDGFRQQHRSEQWKAKYRPSPPPKQYGLKTEEPKAKEDGSYVQLDRAENGGIKLFNPEQEKQVKRNWYNAALEAPTSGSNKTEETEDSEEVMLQYFGRARGPYEKRFIRTYLIYRPSMFLKGVDGAYMINSTVFDNFLREVRRQQNNAKLDSHKTIAVPQIMVEEVIPLNSIHQPDGSYSTPDGITVPLSLRQEVDELNWKYRQFMTREYNSVPNRVQLQAHLEKLREYPDGNF